MGLEAPGPAECPKGKPKGLRVMPDRAMVGDSRQIGCYDAAKPPVGNSVMDSQAFRTVSRVPRNGVRWERRPVDEDEIERMGETFLKLDLKMDELKATFGLQDEDLNLNLGPLGDLISEE